MKRILLLLSLLCCLPAGATVVNQSNSVSFTCTGTTGPFPFTFPISDPTAMTVTQNGTLLSPAVYSIVPVNNNYDNGGSVTLNTACPSAQILTLLRATPITQITVFSDNMPLPMKAFENSVDKLTEIDLDHDALINGLWMMPIYLLSAPSGACFTNNQVAFVINVGIPFPEYICYLGVWTQVGGGGGGGGGSGTVNVGAASYFAWYATSGNAVSASGTLRFDGTSVDALVPLNHVGGSISGTENILPTGTASAGGNFPSNPLLIEGSAWNGIGAQLATWTLQNTLVPGTNPNATLNLSYGGPFGTGGTVQVPALAVANSAKATQMVMAYSAGHAPAGVSGSAVIAPDTSGNLDVSENGGTIYRVCTSGNGVCTGSGTVTSIVFSGPLTGGTITSTGTVGCATCLTTSSSIDAGQLINVPMICAPSLGDGYNAIPAQTYLQTIPTTCPNGTGSTWTISSITCASDNSGSSTCAVTNGSGTSLITGTCTAAAAGTGCTQSATTTIANGDYLKITLVSDGSSKQIGVSVVGTY